MKQVVFIHGGETFDSYESFIEDLKTWTVDPFLERKKWRMTLRVELGSAYQVILPEMPNKQNAKYAEWEIWFEKFVPFIEPGAIYIGHSLGGSFLLKFVSEHEEIAPIRALYLISAPFFVGEGKEGGGFRAHQEKFLGVSQKVQELVFVHAKDDPVVPFSHFESYTELFPIARNLVLEEGGHFVQESFPELIEDIRRLNQ